MKKYFVTKVGNWFVEKQFKLLLWIKGETQNKGLGKTFYKEKYSILYVVG